jgi:predicted GNAT family N-acyltransferase
VRITSFPEAEVPADLRAQVLALHREAWPDLMTGRQPGHDPALRPLSLLLVEESGRVVSALDILSKDITHREHSFHASGLSTVVTGKADRGKGYGRRLVEAGRDTIEASGADLGIFTCDAPLRTFYERAGWETLPGTVLVGGTPEAPFPSDQFDKVTMARFFSAKARRFASTFVGARVELYSGVIDRLW